MDLAETDLRNKVDYRDKVYVDLDVLLDWINRRRLLYLATSASFAYIVDDYSDCEDKYDPNDEICDIVVTRSSLTSIGRLQAILNIWIVVWLIVIVMYRSEGIYSVKNKS